MIDANMVVSSALNPAGLPRRAITLAQANATIVLSDAVHAEISEVVARRKFARVLTDDRRQEILALLNMAEARLLLEDASGRRVDLGKIASFRPYVRAACERDRVPIF